MREGLLQLVSDSEDVLTSGGGGAESAVSSWGSNINVSTVTDNWYNYYDFEWTYWGLYAPYEDVSNFPETRSFFLFLLWSTGSWFIWVEFHLSINPLKKYEFLS